MILPKFKEGDLVSASDWNLIASEVNRIWESEAGEGIELIKGERWRIKYKAGEAGTISTWFNARTRRVIVERGDSWDYGGTGEPTAFYVAGAFTTLNQRKAQRFAKVVKSASGGSARDSVVCNNVGFTAETFLLSQDKSDSSRIYVGSNGLANFPPLTSKNVFLIGKSSGQLDPDWSGYSFPVTPLIGLASVSDRVIAHDYTTLVALDDTASLIAAHSSPVNMHSVVSDGTSVFLSMRRVFTGVPTGYDGDQYPDGIRKLNKNGGIIPAFDSVAGIGAGCCCFFGIIPGKEAWDNGDKFFYSSTSLEYLNSLDMTWDGIPFGGASSAGIIKISEGGVLYGLDISMTHVGPDFTEGNTSDRAWLFCKSPSDEIWFGGGVTGITDGAGSFSVTPYRLYKYNENSLNAAEIATFNGTVWDCQFFREVDGIEQFIVCGDFTECNGDPVEYIAFIDQDGNRLSDLEWP
jgi:hypothetical protein